MFWLQILSNFFKILRAGQTPRQVAGGFALGSIVGLSPSFTLQGLLVGLSSSFSTLISQPLFFPLRSLPLPRTCSIRYSTNWATFFLCRSTVCTACGPRSTMLRWHRSPAQQYACPRKPGGGDPPFAGVLYRDEALCHRISNSSLLTDRKVENLPGVEQELPRGLVPKNPRPGGMT